jgi:hypothetical protein
MSALEICGQLKQLLPTVALDRHPMLAEFTHSSPLFSTEWIVLDTDSNRVRQSLDIGEDALYITSKSLCCDIAVKGYRVQRGAFWNDCLPDAADPDRLDVLAESGVFSDIDERPNAVWRNDMSSLCKVDDTKSSCDGVAELLASEAQTRKVLVPAPEDLDEDFGRKVNKGKWFAHCSALT